MTRHFHLIQCRLIRRSVRLIQISFEGETTWWWSFFVPTTFFIREISDKSKQKSGWKSQPKQKLTPKLTNFFLVCCFLSPAKSTRSPPISISRHWHNNTIIPGYSLSYQAESLKLLNKIILVWDYRWVDWKCNLRFNKSLVWSWLRVNDDCLQVVPTGQYYWSPQLLFYFNNGSLGFPQRTQNSPFVNRAHSELWVNKISIFLKIPRDKKMIR